MHPTNSLEAYTVSIDLFAFSNIFPHSIAMGYY